jgi:hypothetical protein
MNFMGHVHEVAGFILTLLSAQVVHVVVGGVVAGLLIVHALHVPAPTTVPVLQLKQ